MSDSDNGSIPSIKYFGTTWHERGARYWLRRFSLLLFSLSFVAIILGGATIFVAGILPALQSTGGRAVVVLLSVAAVSWSCLSAYVKLRRSEEDRKAHRPLSFARSNPSDVRARGAVGVATGVFASGGSGLAGGLLAVGSLFVVGQVFGVLAITLGRYINDEEWQLAQEYGIERRRRTRRFL